MNAIRTLSTHLYPLTTRRGVGEPGGRIPTTVVGVTAILGWDIEVGS